MERYRGPLHTISIVLSSKKSHSFSVLSALCAVSFCAESASASTIHHVHFSQDPSVIVWDGTGVVRSGSHVKFNQALAVAEPEFPGSGQLLSPVPGPGAGFSKAAEFRITSNASLRVKALALFDDSSSVISCGLIPTQTGQNAIRLNAELPGSVSWDENGQATCNVVIHQKIASKPGNPISQSIGFKVRWSQTPRQVTTIVVSTR